MKFRRLKTREKMYLRNMYFEGLLSWYSILRQSQFMKYFIFLKVSIFENLLILNALY